MACVTTSRFESFFYDYCTTPVFAVIAFAFAVPHGTDYTDELVF